MKNNIYKILFIFAISILIVPQVTLAAWWNPFTWKIFNKTPEINVQSANQSSELEKLRSEVEELKKKTATPTPTPATTTPVSSGGYWDSIIQQTSTSSDEKKKVEVKTPTKSSVVSKLSNSQIIEKIKPAVVYIETDAGSGSGMTISPDGYVLTNAHVVEGFTNVTVSTVYGFNYQGIVIGRDENADLAVIKINPDGNLWTVKFGNSDILAQGDEVFTLGFPFGIKGDVSFKEGTVSRKIDGYIETSAETHPGNSGGPLVNKYGQVVGINTLTYGHSVKGIQIGETIKLAIPINTAKSIIPDLKNGRNVVADKLPESKEKIVTTDMDLRDKYIVFRREVSKILDEYNVAGKYVASSVENFNHASCNLAVVNADNALNSLNSIYQLALNLQVPQVTFYDTANDFIKAVRSSIGYSKELMQTTKQYCSKFLQGANPDNLSDLFNESVRIHGLLIATKNDLLNRFDKLNDEEVRFLK